MILKGNKQEPPIFGGPYFKTCPNGEIESGQGASDESFWGYLTFRGKVWKLSSDYPMGPLCMSRQTYLLRDGSVKPAGLGK